MIKQRESPSQQSLSLIDGEQVAISEGSQGKRLFERQMTVSKHTLRTMLLSWFLFSLFITYMLGLHFFILFYFFLNLCKWITPLSIPNLSFLVWGDEVFYFLLLKNHLSAIKFAVLIKSFGGMVPWTEILCSNFAPRLSFESVRNLWHSRMHNCVMILALFCKFWGI